MTTQSENTKRIAKNTLMLYVRMLFSMLVSLYTSRVVLNALGVEDYGIYNIVGGFVAMFSLVSSSLSSSASRFITFELGRGDHERLRKVFSTSLSTQITLCLIIFILLETIGLWFLNIHLTIPSERLVAARYVFQFSVAAFMVGLLSVPYNASIISHEHMNVYAYMGIADVLLRLCIVICIAYCPYITDRLIMYSFLLLLVGISLQVFYVWYCHKHFLECRSKIRFHKNFFKELGGFAVWNFIGCIAGLLKDQGVNILLNMFHGPVLNAARGIAVSVSTVIGSFAGNFMTALNPQITKSYAAADYDYMNKLVARGSRFSFYIMLLLITPVVLETEFILKFWLKGYPDFTVAFVRLSLFLSLVDILSNTLITLQTATGKIRNYQLVVGGMLMMNFPLSYLCLKASLSPESVYAVAISVALCCLLLRLFFLTRMVEAFSSTSFIKNVVANVIGVSFLSFALPGILHFFFPDGWIRFFTILFVSLVCTGLAVLYIGCSSSERRFIYDKILVLRTRIIEKI